MARYFLSALFLCAFVSPAATPVAGTNEDFSAVSKSVVHLLQSRDTAHFAAELAPTIEDFQSILSTNVALQNPDPLAGWQQSTKEHRQRIEQDAKQLLAKADSLHVDFSKGTLGAQVLPPKYLGKSSYPGLNPHIS